VDALSFLVSAVALLRMRGRETPPATVDKSSSFVHDARAGLRLVVTHRLLRGFTGCSTMGNTAINIHLAVYVLYLTRELGMQPAAIGLLYALAGAGGLLGASLAPRLSRALGAGRTTSLSQLAHGVCLTALPLAGLLGGLALPLMGLSHFVWGLTMTTYTIPAVSLRQAITPDRLQGRIIASQRVLTFGVSPIGFLIGGALGEWVGIWPTLVIAGAGLLLSNLFLSLSPLPRVRDAESLPRELAIVEPSAA
jgi:predicted MFS family arabinose efflux permease